MSLQIQENESLVRFHEFIRACDTMGTLASRLGISVCAILDQHSPNFMTLPAADQSAILERLKIYTSLLELSSAEELLDEKKLLWFALSRLRLAPTSDSLGLLGENDLVEVYVGARQVYRSFNYYNYCSYSLDELETIPWNLLFARNEELTEQIFAEVARSLSSGQILSSLVPAHEVREIRSAFNNKFLYRLKYIVPLRDMEGQRQDCFLAILSAEILETTQISERNAQLKKYFDRKIKEYSGDV